MLNSRAVGPSKVSLLLLYAKSLATMETDPSAHCAHFIPSVLISHSKKIVSRTLCVLTLKRKLTLRPTTFTAISNIERWQHMWYILYWFNISQTKRRYWNSERLFGDWHKFRQKWWVSCLFHLKVLFGVISHSEIQHYFSFPDQC